MRVPEPGSSRSLRFEPEILNSPVVDCSYLLKGIVDLPALPPHNQPGQSLTDNLALLGRSVGEDDPDGGSHFPHFLSIPFKNSYSPTPRMYTIVRGANSDGSRNEVTMEEEKYIDETAGTNFIYSPPIVRSEARGSRRALLRKRSPWDSWMTLLYRDIGF